MLELNRILKDYDSLPRNERTAYDAFFRGAWANVTKYKDREFVMFGKAECEWVDFDKVWLGKFIDFEWLAYDQIDNGDYIEYTFEVTDKGWSIKEAKQERWNLRSMFFELLCFLNPLIYTEVYD